MAEFLHYGFMQRALLSSILIGTLCSIIGVFVILKGLSFIGAGTSHAAFAGVTLGYLIQFNPFVLAIVFGLGTVWTIGALYEKGKSELDVSTGIFYTLTMALAILFIGLMKVYNAEVYGYLFGSILSVTPADLEIMLGLGGVVLFLIFLFYKEFHFITFDQDMAEASGIPARRFFFLLLTLISLTIVISFKAVGALLVFAMVIIPAASAYQFACRMKTMMALSIGFGVFASIGGVIISYEYDLPSGATIVLLAAFLFFLSILFSKKKKRFGLFN
ncbi:MAG: metal ABC transporter permease [Nitrospirae bacterium]|nr:metal ABC transporter permease [Nitrospirota bacterium]MBI3351693.1 metal ABC transporter permease [Nitrospirota bacterium]